MEPDQFPTPVSRHLPLARRFEAAIVSGLRKARSRRVTCDGANSSAFLVAYFLHAPVSPWLNRVQGGQGLAGFLLAHPAPLLAGKTCRPFARALHVLAISRV